MPSAIIRNISALWTRSGGGAAAKNLSADKRIITRATGGEAGLSFLTFSLPAPHGAVYKSAKLRLYNSAAINVSETTYVNRVTSGWSVAKTTWNSRPSFTNTGRVGVTKATAPKNTMWEFDVTAMLNAASNGTNPWMGFAISSGASTAWRYFYHPAASATYGPVLEVEWSEAPLAPQLLNPDISEAVSKVKPTLQTDFFDVVGETTMSAIQVQMSNAGSIPTWEGTPWWDSGTVLTDVPELDLADTAKVPAPPTLVSGSAYWWRVRVRDSGGIWSDWTMSAFYVQAKGTVTLNNPGASPNNFVEEATPPVLWSTAGMTQTAYQVMVWDADKTTLLLDTDKVTSADGSATLNSWKTVGVSDSPLEVGKTYQLELRVWDSVVRATTPGDPPYVTVERAFTYKETATVGPVTSIALIPNSSNPWATIEVARATAPDQFSLWRDGVCIMDNLDAANHDVGGGKYRIVDRTATPREQHKWMVKATVNSKTSTANPELTATVKPVTAYLSDYRGAWSVPFLNYSVDLGTSDGSSTTMALNSDEAITIYQGGGAREGDFVGILSGGVNSTTARQHLTRILEMRDPKNRGKTCVLTYADQSITCSVSQIDFQPTIYSEEICYAVSFHVAEKRTAL